MKARIVHEYDQGLEATNRFKSALKKILSVSREQMEGREKQYQAERVLKPKRGPKRKVKPFASRDHDSDD